MQNDNIFHLQWFYSIPAFCSGQVKRRAPAVQSLIPKFGVGKSQTFFLQAVNGGIVMAIFYSGYLVKDGEKYFNATIDDVVSEYHIKGVSFGINYFHMKVTKVILGPY